MATSAQEYADATLKQGTMVHSDSYNIAPPAGPAGENLAMSSAAMDAAGVVGMW